VFEKRTTVNGRKRKPTCIPRTGIGRILLSITVGLFRKAFYSNSDGYRYILRLFRFRPFSPISGPTVQREPGQAKLVRLYAFRRAGISRTMIWRGRDVPSSPWQPVGHVQGGCVSLTKNTIRVYRHTFAYSLRYRYYYCRRYVAISVGRVCTVPLRFTKANLVRRLATI